MKLLSLSCVGQSVLVYWLLMPAAPQDPRPGATVVSREMHIQYLEHGRHKRRGETLRELVERHYFLLRLIIGRVWPQSHQLNNQRDAIDAHNLHEM